MKRLHVHVAVKDLADSVRFYSTPGLGHLGLQVESDGELREVAEQLRAGGQDVLVQKNAACCYTRSDKAWVADPQGVRWETFRSVPSARSRPSGRT